MNGIEARPQEMRLAAWTLQTMMETQVMKIVEAWLGLKTDRRGVTALEYGLIASLVALAVIAGASLLGNNIGFTFTKVAGQLISN